MKEDNGFRMLPEEVVQAVPTEETADVLLNTAVEAFRRAAMAVGESAEVITQLVELLTHSSTEVMAEGLYRLERADLLREIGIWFLDIQGNLEDALWCLQYVADRESLSRLAEESRNRRQPHIDGFASALCLEPKEFEAYEASVTEADDAYASDMVAAAALGRLTVWLEPPLPPRQGDTAILTAIRQILDCWY